MWTDCTMPMATKEVRIEDPPDETNGSGMPVTGMIPRVIPMFSKMWNSNMQRMPTQMQGPELVPGELRGPPDPPDHHPQQPNEQPGSQEAELLADDGEDEVRFLHRNEPAAGLRALAEPVAREASR